MPKLTSIILVLLLVSCVAENQSDLTLPSQKLEYFGFTLIDTYWDDPSDNETKTNYIDEVHEFSNMADILVVNPTDNIVARMKAINNLQMKSVLHLSELFFELIGTDSPSGANYNLRADYKARWDQFIRTNNLEINHNLVQTFYIGEEPTWNGISFIELKAATDYVKSTIASVPIMIIEAYPIIDQLQVPTSVDWIGFDHYFIKDPTTNVEYLTELKNLLSKFSTEEQRLVIVMDTHYISAYHGDYGRIALNEMDMVANNYYKLAESEPKTIAILGYFWPSGFDVPTSIGARNMPKYIKENYMRIGKEITKKN